MNPLDIPNFTVVSVSPSEQSNTENSMGQPIKTFYCDGYGGVIFMRLGVSKFVSPEWSHGVCQCLLATHKAGYVHCDIRSPNMLKFGDTFQLIDYDHGGQLDVNGEAIVYISSSGAQRKTVGPRVARLLCSSDVVEWTIIDDYEMLLECILKMVSLKNNDGP